MKKYGFFLFLVLLLAFVLTVPNASAVGPPTKHDPRLNVDDPFSVDDGSWPIPPDRPATLNSGPPRKRDGSWVDVRDDTGWGTDRSTPSASTGGPPGSKDDGWEIPPHVRHSDTGWAGKIMAWLFPRR